MTVSSDAWGAEERRAALVWFASPRFSGEPIGLNRNVSRQNKVLELSLIGAVRRISSGAWRIMNVRGSCENIYLSYMISARQRVSFSSWNSGNLSSDEEGERFTNLYAGQMFQVGRGPALTVSYRPLFISTCKMRTLRFQLAVATCPI